MKNCNVTAALAALTCLTILPACASEIVNVNVLDASNPYEVSVSIDPHGVYPTARGVVIYPGANGLSAGAFSNVTMLSQRDFVERAPGLGFGLDDLTTVVSGTDAIVGVYHFTKMTLLRGMFRADNSVFLLYMQSLITPSFTQPTDEPYYRDALESANWFTSEPVTPTSDFLLLGDGTAAGTAIVMVTDTPEPASIALFLLAGLVVLFCTKKSQMVAH